ncbi:MAG: geranylgeranylglyceryl/heptaprenylglyceryl phosphate synthase [bacterium]|nr:geranylgeranylglyceryl/heptaprenylglyceryl phosphate synthase [bacterium]
MEIVSPIEKIFRKNKKGYFVLIDPAKNIDIEKILKNINSAKVDGIFVGGSDKKIKGFDKFITSIKEKTKKPVFIFPGSHYQISNRADFLLLLFLLNTKKLDYIIGEHINGAENLFKSSLKIIPTSYILCMDDRRTSVAKRVPINFIKDMKYFLNYIYLSEISNFKTVYLEAGSGSDKTVPLKFIKSAKKILSKPLIVGGGIKDGKTAFKILENGADFIVTGNIIEKDPDKIFEFSEVVNIF